MKIMSDEDALDSVDTEDTEEDLFSPCHRRVHRDLNNHKNSNQDLKQNDSIRRSTRNKSQTYDNLNTSWIFGTQTLKGYPMYNQQCSSSDKEMVDEHPPRQHRLRRRMSLRSREGLATTKSSRHVRESNCSLSNNREVRVRSYRLRDRSDRDHEHHERQELNQELRGRPRRGRSLRNHSEHDRSLRSERERRISEPSERELRSRHQHKEMNHHEDKSDQDVDLRTLKDNQNKTNTTIKTESKDNKIEIKVENNKKELRSSKTENLSITREGPVTRQRHSYSSKEKQPKSKTAEEDEDDENQEEGEEGEDEEEEEEEEEEDDENSQESEKAENNTEGYTDMYSRVKRTRRVSQRVLQKRQINAEDSDMSESSDTPGPRKYSLRQKKPTVDRLQIHNEPVRRSIRERTFRSVYTTAVRRRKHRSKSSTSSDSSDSEAQCYDKKKNKKSRQTSIPQGGPSDRKADISPITVDGNLTFNDVGGLESHIHCLKEMVVFPMLYPEVFDRFHITPPKGVLFHGPPGTGKTLIARALANECSRDNRKVSFFMRKGADCLTKWVGESERQLRLLFEQAQQMKPSIIFFDEIDGLAPVRSTKQDQIHASIVSTLLALMDGLTDRGEVIVIGATNRIDAIDPALRRPGRFDRELFFPLPAVKERLEILKIHVKKWSNPPDENLLQILADKSTGYCGSDLKALCTEAVIQGLKRTYPQIYLSSRRLLLNPTKVEVKKDDFEKASSLLVPASHRVAPCIGKRLLPFIEPLLSSILNELFCTTRKMFPQGTNPALSKLKITKGVHRPRLLITGGYIARNQGPKLAKALIYKMEHLPVHSLNVSTLFAESARSPEETCVQVFNEASRNLPSIIYITAIDQWWPLVPETVKAVLLCRISSLDSSVPILILATSEVTYEELPDQLQQLFSKLRGEVFTIEGTTEEQRAKFFKPIFTVQSLRPPVIKKKSVEPLEELPLAPDPEPKKLTPEEQKILYEKEEVSLRELRIFLREICAKLARNKQFFMFTKPVDTEEVPDYNDIIKQPMDLETMMTKIDMHFYLCARDFLDDIDLICTNALEYNPDRDPADKLIRHRACSLRDNAYALIKAELDSDFEDKCREISKNRKMQKEKKKDSSKKENTGLSPSADSSQVNFEKQYSSGSTVAVNGRVLSSSISRKRRCKSSWARGLVKRVHKKKKISFEDDGTVPAANSTTGHDDSQGIDLEKFQEFENEMHAAVNGHVFNNCAESDNENCNDCDHDHESQNESSMELDKGMEDQPENGLDLPGIKEIEPDAIEKESDSAELPLQRSNSRASLCSLRDSLDDLSFAIDSDSSLSAFTPEERERVIIDRDELENGYAYTVNATANFPIELLCDTYVQLSRRVGQYYRTYDRKSLPKDLLEDVKSFEKFNTLEKEKVVHH